MATATDLRKRVTTRLLEEISEVQYPSTTMLNRVEPTLAGPDDLSDYIEVLVEKVEATRFPSISLLNRLDGLLDQLEQFEQQQRRQAEASRADDSREQELQAA
jgi:hypothetical protein